MHTTYAEFPQRLAEKHVGVCAATGYTWVTLSGNSTSAYGYRRRRLLFIQHLLNDAEPPPARLSRRHEEYENDRGVGNWTARPACLSIMTSTASPTTFRSDLFPLPLICIVVQHPLLIESLNRPTPADRPKRTSISKATRPARWM